MRYLYPIGLGAIILFVVWTLFAPVEYTIASRFGQLLGAIEEAWIETRLPAVVEQTEEVGEAEARVTRRTQAVNEALKAQSDIVRRQVTSIDNSHIVKRLGAAATDIACGVGVMSETLSPERRTDDTDQGAAKLIEFCALGMGIRRSMVEDYSTINNGRTTVMSDMLEKFEQAGE